MSTTRNPQPTTRASQPTAPSPRFGALIDEVRSLVGDLKAGVDLALELPQIAPELFGANGAKTYLVLGQTSDELRASGGFVSGVWQLTFLEGSLVNIEYTDVVEVDDLDRLELYPPPPQPLERHMNASVWLMRDVTWVPDFPSTAAVARELYRLGQRRTVDGVFAVTPWAFLEVTRALGAIPSPQGPIQPEELMSALERGTDEMGREYMDTLFQGVVDLIDSRAAQEDLLDLGIALRRSLEEKQLLIWMAREEAQSLVHRFNWDGAIAMPEGDRVVAVDSNIGWSKVDRNIDRAMSYRVELDPEGPARAELRLTYANRSGPGATGCDSQFMDRGSAYDLLKNTCYWNFLRAYVALGATLVDGDPLPLPRHSIVEQTGTGEPGQPTLREEFTSFGPAYSGLLTVAPHESRTVTFVYDVPRSVVDWRRDFPTYRLTLQPQPGTLNRDTRVAVVIPEGFDFVDSSIAPAEIRGKTAIFDIALRADTLLEVRMARAGSA